MIKKVVDLGSIQAQIAKQRNEIVYSIAMTMNVIGILWGIIFFFIGAIQFAGSAIVAVFSIQVMTFIGRRGYEKLARFWFVTHINLVIFYYALMFGEASNTHLSFLSLVGLPLVINRKGNSLLTAYGIVLPIGFYMGLYSYGFEAFKPVIVLPSWIWIPTGLSAFCMVQTIVGYLYHYGNRAESVLQQALTGLGENEERFRQTLDAIPDLVIVKWTATSEIWVNRAFRDFFGIKPSESKQLRDLDKRWSIDSQDLLAFETGKNIEIPCETFADANGKLHQLNTLKCPILRGYGHASALVSVSRDITAQQLARQALWESGIRFRAVFENSAVGIAVIDSNQKIVDCNEKLQMMSGYSMSEFRSMTIADFTRSPETSDIGGDDALQQLIGSGGINLSQEKLVVRKDGSTFWIRLTTSFLSIRGKENEIVAFVEDLSESKAAQAVIVEQNTKIIAASKMSSLGEMAGGIAHEINNPLAVICGRAHNLKKLVKRLPFDEKRAEDFIEDIDKTAKRIAKIVAGLRSFSRTADGDPYSPYSLQIIVNDTLELCGERLRNGGVELEIAEISESAMIDCRPVEISQVLINLINNAFDAQSDQSQKWIKLSVDDVGEGIEIAVTNGGPKIPPSTQQKLFQPFFTTKMIGKGTGLGLSVSQGIAEGHFGKLRLDAECANTKFILTIPKNRMPRKICA